MLYKNENKIIGRITTTYYDNPETSILDFKGYQKDQLRKISREVTSIKINNKNMPSILSMLDILDFKENKTLERKKLFIKRVKSNLKWMYILNQKNVLL